CSDRNYSIFTVNRCPLWVISGRDRVHPMSALPPKADMCGATRDVRFGPIADIAGLGMRRCTLLELSGMEFHEVAHIRRRFADELAHGFRHAVVTPLLGQLSHGREMPDDVFRKPHLTKAFAPHWEWYVAISDGPAERLGEDTRIVVQISRFRPRQ